MGGSNLYTSAPDFLKLLASLLRKDGKLLRPQTVDIMFDHRLPDFEVFTKFKIGVRRNFSVGWQQTVVWLGW